MIVTSFVVRQGYGTVFGKNFVMVVVSGFCGHGCR